MMPETERTMLDRLRLRYGTQVRNGTWTGAKYLRAEHVPLGLRWDRSRIADFIAVSLHSHREPDQAARYGYAHTAPPVYHGHEVKVSRSDWLAELADPTKAEAFSRYMHTWWLVVPDVAIVRDDLPDGWGLMVSHDSSVRVAVPAPIRQPEQMPSGMVGALLRAVARTESSIAVAKAGVA